jgi:hypothetical protein
MQIRRAEAADEEALAWIRRDAIRALAVSAMSREQAERWATRGGGTYGVVRRIRLEPGHWSRSCPRYPLNLHDTEELP